MSSPVRSVLSLLDQDAVSSWMTVRPDFFKFGYVLAVPRMPKIVMHEHLLIPRRCSL